MAIAARAPKSVSSPCRSGQIRELLEMFSMQYEKNPLKTVGGEAIKKNLRRNKIDKSINQQRRPTDRESPVVHMYDLAKKLTRKLITRKPPLIYVLPFQGIYYTY